MIKHVTSGTFQADVLSSEQPILVDFWATWCPPCIAMEPTLEQAAKDFDGKVQIAKLNVDENPDIAEKYGVMSIPTMFIFKNGEPINRLVGLTGKDKLESALKTAL